MKQITIPPTNQIEASTEVQPLGGLATKNQLSTKYPTKNVAAIAINAPILKIQTRGALLKEVMALTARDIFL